MDTKLSNENVTHDKPSSRTNKETTVGIQKDKKFENILDENNLNFFTKEEMKKFLFTEENLILYKTNGVPYINYDLAKPIFDQAVGGNYNIILVNSEFISEFETQIIQLRITLTRGNKIITRDVIGTATPQHDKETKEISNYEDLCKIAYRNAMSKFFCDSIGIGAKQLAEAKKIYADRYKNKNSTPVNQNTNQNIPQNTNQSANQNLSVNTQPVIQNAQVSNSNNNQYTCEDCGRPITQKIYDYCVTYHCELRPLCPKCQKNY